MHTAQQNEVPPDRRNQDALLSMVATVLEEQRQIGKALADHIADETGQIAAAFAAAFPDGDAGLHKRRHEADILLLEERAQFWKIMRTEVAKWGLIGFLGFAAVALWQHFLQGPRV